MNSFLPLTAAILLNLGTHSVQAAELNGVKFEDTLSSDQKQLQLNGLGLRKKAIFKVYVAGLYLESKSSDAKSILESNQEANITLKFLRDVDSKTISEAFATGFEKNCPNKCAAFKEEVTKLGSLLTNIKEGDSISFKIKPETLVFVASDSKSHEVNKSGFAKEFLKLFLGDHPPQDSLKQGLLGKS
jgi:hypothetical protein